MDVPTNARVECVDGAAGRCSGVIIDPTTWQVTHLLASESEFPRTERLVSMDWVLETTPDLVRLRCSKSRLAAMLPLVETRYEQWSRSTFVGEPYSAWYGWPYVALTTTLLPIKHERVPPGEWAVRQGTLVQAVDGQVGRVDEFLADPANKQITHLVLRKGHLWGQKDVAIPISKIARAQEKTIYLQLDRSAIKSLPAIPVRQWRHRHAG